MSAWNTCQPPTGVVVEVYYWGVQQWIDAYWDGHQWRTTEGAPLSEVTHWRWQR